MRNQLVVMLGLVMVACSGAGETGNGEASAAGQPAAPAAASGDGNANSADMVDGSTPPSSSADAGKTTTGPTTSAPSMLTVTGKFTPTCTHASAPNLDYDCHFVITNVTVSPALPAGMAIQEAIDISSENRSPADMGWMTGLAVTAPAYPSSCFQNLYWGQGDSLNYTVFPYQPQSKSTNCGLITAQHSTVGTADFAQGFTANLKAVYAPTGKVIDVRVMLTR
ncbi:MAG: hypothetical protein QOI41_7444 [Myxococcales bacterium]|nr:hypothetical protein [Myxococcales bacterium]